MIGEAGGGQPIHMARGSAGIRRFLFSSSCSLYGAAGDEPLTETAAFRPLTPYGYSKVHVEDDVARLAAADFSPTFLRNATAYRRGGIAGRWTKPSARPPASHRGAKPALEAQLGGLYPSLNPCRQLRSDLDRVSGERHPEMSPKDHRRN